MEKIIVSLRENSYPIMISSNLFNNPNIFYPLKTDSQVVLITNETVATLYLTLLKKTLTNIGVKVDQIILSDGEQYKTLPVVNQIFTLLLQKYYGRDTTLIALGGGVIGDLTGFTAANYQRGIRFIQVPTTLLAQVDSSIGGKTAINHPLGKNMIGAFYHPTSVIINLDFLQSLPFRELASGMAEVIKYGIVLDKKFFHWIEQNIDELMTLKDEVIIRCIRRCCELKTEIIEADERETEVRELLNLGHTYGHAIEAHIGYGTWLHGEAISVGMIMAARTAERLGYFSTVETEQIINLLERAGLPVYGPEEMTPMDYFPYMLRDKKTISGKIRLVLPISIGKVKIYHDVSHDIVASVIEECRNKK